MWYKHLFANNPLPFPRRLSVCPPFPERGNHIHKFSMILTRCHGSNAFPLNFAFINANNDRGKYMPAPSRRGPRCCLERLGYYVRGVLTTSTYPEDYDGCGRWKRISPSCGEFRLQDCNVCLRSEHKSYFPHYTSASLA